MCGEGIVRCCSSERSGDDDDPGLNRMLWASRLFIIVLWAISIVLTLFTPNALTQPLMIFDYDDFHVEVRLTKLMVCIEPNTTFLNNLTGFHPMPNETTTHCARYAWHMKRTGMCSSPLLNASCWCVHDDRFRHDHTCANYESTLETVHSFIIIAFSIFLGITESYLFITVFSFFQTLCRAQGYCEGDLCGRIIRCLARCVNNYLAYILQLVPLAALLLLVSTTLVLNLYWSRLCRESGSGMFVRPIRNRRHAELGDGARWLSALAVFCGVLVMISGTGLVLARRSMIKLLHDDFEFLDDDDIAAATGDEEEFLGNERAGGEGVSMSSFNAGGGSVAGGGASSSSSSVAVPRARGRLIGRVAKTAAADGGAAAAAIGQDDQADATTLRTHDTRVAVRVDEEGRQVQ